MNGVKKNLVGRDICLSKTCSVTHEEYSVMVSFPKYVMWKDKQTLIQDVFPELNADEREFLISGWTPSEWNKMMAHEK